MVSHLSKNDSHLENKANTDKYADKKGPLLWMQTRSVSVEIAMDVSQKQIYSLPQI